MTLDDIKKLEASGIIMVRVEVAELRRMCEAQESTRVLVQWLTERPKAALKGRKK